jgi:TolA-binding protein
MKDTRSWLMVLLSFGLVSTWVYHLYDKAQYSQQRNEVYIKDSIAVAESVKDSLQKIYTATISKLDTRLDSTKTDADSLKTQLEVKLGEINKLRNEISGILKNGGSTRADFKRAQQKIAELQQKIEELQNQNISMEEERKRLTALLDQLNGNMKGMEETARKLGDENKMLTEKIGLASLFISSEVQLSAVAVNDDKEQETTQAKKAEKFVLSFKVQNNVTDYSDAEIFVVIIQPDGKVLSNEVWDSNMFDSRKEGKKNFTRKIRFEYNKGETKALLFTLNSNSYQKGNYIMQIYHNGIKIGQVIKTLS